MAQETLIRVFETPAGFVGIAGTDRALRRMFLPESTFERALRLMHAAEPSATLDETETLLPELVTDLQRYFGGKPVRFRVKLDCDDCAPFHRDVWHACRRIPFGKTASYGELARAVGKPAAARAVGMAMGRNRCPIVIPCHRVLRSDGS
ncbi:MAG: methylated-DNA--[protein]-cysteine S-methyltransferase, partial [Phycisphaerae bacterium]